ncbi:hypothetical protein [Nitrosomonas sp.]|uniref:hypothetical protein n=1 Tax=Nitrosomonas sp. TaxID=42353 RepID=UPI0025F4F84F|nr:hypothetical protein [Nitrosomonas sp.]
MAAEIGTGQPFLRLRISYKGMLDGEVAWTVIFPAQGKSLIARKENLAGQVWKTRL